MAVKELNQFSSLDNTEGPVTSVAEIIYFTCSRNHPMCLFVLGIHIIIIVQLYVSSGRIGTEFFFRKKKVLFPGVNLEMPLYLRFIRISARKKILYKDVYQLKLHLTTVFMVSVQTMNRAQCFGAICCSSSLNFKNILTPAMLNIKYISRGTSHDF